MVSEVRLFIGLMTSDRKLKASSEGSKRRIYGTKDLSEPRLPPSQAELIDALAKQSPSPQEIRSSPPPGEGPRVGAGRRDASSGEKRLRAEVETLQVRN